MVLIVSGNGLTASPEAAGETTGMLLRFLVVCALLIGSPAWSSPKEPAPKAVDAGHGNVIVETSPLDAAFHDATARGDIAKMAALHKKGVSVNTRDFRGMGFGPGVTPKNEYGLTPLFTALRANKLEAARWLLEHGANASATINSMSIFGNELTGDILLFDDVAPLDLAVSRRQNSLVKLLLQHGATSPLPRREKDERTPRAFMLAALQGSVETMQLLLDNYTPKRKAMCASDSLIWAVNGRGPQMINLLLAQGADGKGCGAALVEAVNRRQFDIAEMLAPHTDWHAISSFEFFRAIVRQGDEDVDPFPRAALRMKGGPTQWREVFQGYVDNVSQREPGNRLLLALLRLGASKGANPNATKKGYDTPLMDAIRDGKRKFVVALLDAGASAKASPPGKMAPLWFLAADGVSTKSILEAGGSSSPPMAARGASAMELFWAHHAKMESDQDIAIARALIQHGADLKTGDNRFALPAAQRAGNTALAAFFLQQGADPRVAYRRPPAPAPSTVQPLP